MAKLLFQGHGSYRITTDKEQVIYVDPFAGEGYDKPGDLILVTHQHFDHNQLQLPAKKSSCVIIQDQDALQGGSYKSFDIDGIHIQTVPAYNKNHDRNSSVGYIISFDGLKLYASGDTSTTEEMKDFAPMKLDYALLPTDGIYNMDAAEAAKCAELIQAKHAIPIHMNPEMLFDAQKAENFNARNRLIVKAGEEITL